MSAHGAFHVTLLRCCAIVTVMPWQWLLASTIAAPAAAAASPAATTAGDGGMAHTLSPSSPYSVIIIINSLIPGSWLGGL